MITIKSISKENAPLGEISKALGEGLVLDYERKVFSLADKLSEDYMGGRWFSITLSNGAFMMVLNTDADAVYTCVNPSVPGDHDVDAEAFSLALNIMMGSIYSTYLYANRQPAWRVVADNYHKLRDYLFDGGFPELTVQKVLRIID